MRLRAHRMLEGMPGWRDVVAMEPTRTARRHRRSRDPPAFARRRRRDGGPRPRGDVELRPARDRRRAGGFRASDRSLDRGAGDRKTGRADRRLDRCRLARSVATGDGVPLAHPRAGHHGRGVEGAPRRLERRSRRLRWIRCRRARRSDVSRQLSDRGAGRDGATNGACSRSSGRSTR